jgi:hypothetical protein
MSSSQEKISTECLQTPESPETMCEEMETTPQEDFITVKHKRSRDHSPQSSNAVSPVKKQQKPNLQQETLNDANQPRFKFSIQKTEAWSSAFQATLALFKAHPLLDIKQTMNKEGQTILSTPSQETRDLLLKITSLDGKPVKFLQIQSEPPTKRYAVTGVPIEDIPKYFIGLHNITEAVRISKGTTPTTCMVLTSKYETNSE